MKKRDKFILYVLLFLLIVMVGGLFCLKSGWLFSKKLYVYFLSPNEKGEIKLVPFQRKDTGFQTLESKLKWVIENLIIGPEEKEKAEGFFSGIPEETKLLNCEIKNGIVYLDFSSEIEKGGGTEIMRARLAQIVFTATQFPEVKKVRFLINGKMIKYFSGEGITEVENPLGREDFLEFKS